VLLHVVEICCLSETITGVYFTEMHAHATRQSARAVVENLLEDEIDHGRVGWAYLATRARQGRLAGLSSSLPAMLERTAVRAIKQADSSPEGEREMEGCGWLGRSSALAAIRRAVNEVIVPGCETLGVDLGPSMAVLSSLR
jgi:hypothetical protein